MTRATLRRLARLGVLAAGGALLLGAALFWFTLPAVTPLRKGNPATTAFIEARKERLRTAGRSDRIDRVWVPYRRISPNLVQAVVAAEDANFWVHSGIDWEATRNAARAAWRRRGQGKPPKRGGSTITQQLAKNLWFSSERSYLRKAREGVSALRIERHLSKARILEIYLNSIEWGDRTYGAEAAARRWFGKGASTLSREEAAWLAAMIPGPTGAFDPRRHPDRVTRRQRRILRLMALGSGLPSWHPRAADEASAGDDD